MNSVNAAKEVERLLNFALQQNMIEDLDVIPSRNALMDLLQLGQPYEGEVINESLTNAVDVLDNLLDYAHETGLLPENTVTYRDLLDAKIMGLLMPRQSEVVRSFKNTVKQQGIVKATDDFYSLSKASNYIRMDRIEKNLYWLASTEYGQLEITINLSKPEKDPKEIAAAKARPQSNYPKCLLCLENVGYAGHINHPARQNHRVLPLNLAGEQWCFQYSPYVYYNEHCILFHEKHVPMKISEKTFERLFYFVEQFPHYFIGSNADLPIVGGSILTHEHFQGGRHVFPMEEAPIINKYINTKYPSVKAGIVKWPMSVIRLSSDDKNALIELSINILEQWRGYSDEEAGILAFTKNGDEKTPHNTITPIVRKNSAGEFEIDLVLRNNRTSEEHPDGIFHPHKELHHIKKENIGLIEVMGLAVLPARLSVELKAIEGILRGETESYIQQMCAEDELGKHSLWIKELLNKYGYSNKEEVASSILRQEVGNKFLQVLLHAGVYKTDLEGRNAFTRFMKNIDFGKLDK
jgi:UDPglucose--hexose-1-phosphate uridylyltransferase